MNRVLNVIFVVLFFGVSPAAEAASALVMQDRSSIAIASEGGKLQLWAQGEAQPRWSLPIGGVGAGARSRVASLNLLPSGNIMLVERLGDILIIGTNGELVSRYRPIYEYIRLNVDIDKVDWTHWGGQVDSVARTSASFVSDDLRYLYLVPDQWATVRKLAIDDLLKQPSGTIQLTDTLVFQFKDRNITIERKLDPPKFDIGKNNWIVGNQTEATALTACGGWIIGGNADGTVYFVPETGDVKSDQRIRQVGKPGQEPRSILDAICLSADLAATVSFDTGNGQIQLWDMKTKIATSTVGYSTGGHPGMAYTITRSADAKELISIGDGDLRRWSISNNKLSLLNKYFLPSLERQQNFAVVALDGGGFAFWDGDRIMKVPAGGSEPIYYAGRPLLSP